jgi:4-alpha-glucanotransferase
LALEAQRAGAVVIGEDLGTVEPWVREHMRERGMLGTSVLWFERDRDGPLAPQRWRGLCLATVDTHDLPPVGSYLKGEHLRLADRLGLLTRPYEESHGLTPGRSRWLDCSDSCGCARTPPREVITRCAVLAPRALLVGVSVADAVVTAVGKPSRDDRRVPNWRLPLADSEQAVLRRTSPRTR